MLYSYSQSVELIEEMRGHYESGFSSIERTHIERIHLQIFNKWIKRIGCGSCYQDAYILIRSYLKKNQSIPMPNYELKPGIVIHEFGSTEYYINAIPDEIAENYLRKDESRIKEFRLYPEDWKERVYKEEVDEQDIQSAEQVQKKSKKRKH